MPLIDPFGRRIDYLRVSVTDRCNFRCVYCMPEDGFPALPKEEYLSTEETMRLVRVAVSLGMRKIRLTGGEPLLHKGLPDIARAARDAGAEDISITTNGHLLAEQAVSLARAGVNRVNVSLDTLRPKRFREIARRGDLETVLAGIRAAIDAGFGPVKVNCVAMRGVNDDEAADFAAWTLRERVNVRFIELMPLRWSLDEGPSLPTFDAHGGAGLLRLRQAPGGMLSDSAMRRMAVGVAEIRARIEEALGPLEPAEVRTNGPARSFRLPNALGSVGFISQISDDLCSGCNRLRLTHDGYLRPCLLSDGELDLRTALRSGATDKDLRDLFRHVVARKPERHYLAQGQRAHGRGMSQIGG
ncbi:GTP 3',8-cyclase MoaA [bacterium]|nr:MAG: GTP 3',8-cyclase MoaA [bacterium]